MDVADQLFIGIGKTALSTSINEDQPEIISLLLDHMGNGDPVDNSGWSAIFYAVT